jgi:hypothetical protein
VQLYRQKLKEFFRLFFIFFRYFRELRFCAEIGNEKFGNRKLVILERLGTFGWVRAQGSFIKIGLGLL